jgi:hypothetical protein
MQIECGAVRTTAAAWRGSGQASFGAGDGFAPLPARQIRSCVLQPLLNSHEAPLEPLPKLEAVAASQSDHLPVGPQHIAEQQFDAVGRRFAFDFLEQGRAEAKMAPVICNRQAEFAGAFRAPKRHPGLADDGFMILPPRGQEQGQSITTVGGQCARQFRRRQFAGGAQEPIVARLRRKPSDIGLQGVATFSPRTRLNSVALAVTIVAPKVRACAAIRRSFGPIGFPKASSSTRMFAYSTSAGTSKGRTSSVSRIASIRERSRGEPLLAAPNRSSAAAMMLTASP